MLRALLAVLLTGVIAIPSGGLAAGVPPVPVGTPVIIRPQRDRDSRGPLPVHRSGKWGYVDVHGRDVIAPRFDEAGFFYEGRAAVRLDVRWGYIDRPGITVIPPRFGAGARFSNGLAHVRLSDASAERATSAYIDAAGQVVIVCGAASPETGLTAARCGRLFNEGFVAEAIEVFRCVDEAGNPIAKEYPCRAVLIDRWGFYDKRGRLALPGPYHSGLSRFSEGLAAARRHGETLVGFIDAKGAFVVPPQFDQALPFSEGLAAVRVGTAWGYIDRDGTSVIAPQFQSAAAFSEGHAAVRADGRIGYIETNGHFSIPAQFEDAGPFSEGLAAVCCENGGARYIDKTGRFAFAAAFPRGISNTGLFIEGVALVGPDDGRYIDRLGRTVATLRIGK